MTTTAAATAAPVEITLGGKKYRLSPLSWRDYDEFDVWMREEALKQLASTAVISLPDDDRRALHRYITNQAGKLSLTTPPTHDLEAMETIHRIVTSVHGASRLVWLGVRHNHSDIQVEEIENLFADAGIFASVMSQFERINDDGKKNSKKKTTKKRRRKSR